MASTYLSRTLVTPTSTTQYTFSAWVKRTTTVGSSSLNEVIFSNWSSTSNVGYIRFEDQTDTLHIYDNYGGTQKLNYRTTASYRDTNAWYHIVVNADTSRSSGDRCRLYVNGEQVSLTKVSDSTGTLGMLSANSTNGMRLGAINNTGGTEYYLGGLMSHVHFIDGGIYEASDFGEYDANGVWKIKTSPSVTYGTNGFFILKDGNSVTDQSGNGNNFTVGGGTLTNTEDNPSNVFATLNKLATGYGSTVNWSNGNTTVEDPNGSASGINMLVFSTLGVTSGKWYWEAKISNFSTTSGHSYGILRTTGDLYGDSSSSNRIYHIFADTSLYLGKYGSNVETVSGLSSGDIIGIAFDCDNGTVQYYRNGSTLGSQITGVSSANDGYIYFPYFGLESSSSGRYGKYEVNFGNGYFSSTAVASAGTNASGIGIFEHDVPNGYTALSTKGLNL